MTKAIAAQFFIGIVWIATYVHYDLIPFKDWFETFIVYTTTPTSDGEIMAGRYIENKESEYLNSLILLAWLPPIFLVYDATKEFYVKINKDASQNSSSIKFY